MTQIVAPATRTCEFGQLSPSPCRAPAAYRVTVHRGEDYADGSFEVRSAETYRCATHIGGTRHYALRVARIDT